MNVLRASKSSPCESLLSAKGYWEPSIKYGRAADDFVSFSEVLNAGIL